MSAILEVLDEEAPDGMTCWISVGCSDGTHLASGEELDRLPAIILASSAWKHKRIDGIGGIASDYASIYLYIYMIMKSWV